MNFRRLDAPSLEVLAIAQSLAVRRGHSEVGPEHLLLAMLRQPAGFAPGLVAELGASPEELSAALQSLLERVQPEYSKFTRLAGGLVDVLAASEGEADARGSGGITPRHLLAGLFARGGPCSELLGARALTAATIFRPSPSSNQKSGLSDSSPSPVRDLTAEARHKSLHRILGREGTVERLLEILARQRHYPLLLGEKGVGRGAVIEALARALAQTVPAVLSGARLLAIGPAAAADDFEELLAKWTARGSKLFVYFKDPRSLAQAARSLRTFPARDQVTLIGRATPEEYYGSLSRQHYLEGCFETVVVEPLCPATTVLVLRELRGRIESRRDVEIRDDAIEAAADLARRLLPGAKLPGDALRVLEDAAASKRRRAKRLPKELERTEARVAALQAQPSRSPSAEEELSELRTAAGWLRARWEQEKEAEERIQVLRKQLRERPGDELLQRRLRDAEAALPEGIPRLVDRSVTSDDVALVLERRSDASLGGLVLEARSDLTRLEKELARDVLGQRPGARLVASTLMRASTRLQTSGGAGASFLFAGPPGVGKTTMARSLAARFLHDESAFVRLLSYDASGILEAVSRTPRVVVLVRDVHRASLDVQRVLTRVLEEGAFRFRDGRRVDFRQTLLVMSTRESKPGWLGPRVDGVVDFGPLSRDVAHLIADRQCRALSERLAERRIALEWSRAAIEWLAVHAFPHEEGAHRLHRILADEVWNRGRIDAADEFVAEDFVDHMPFPGQVAGREGFKQQVHTIRAAFPDARERLDDLIAEGDKVAARAVLEGTHAGPLFGICPTGQRVEVGGLIVVRIHGGKIVERWAYGDDLGLLTRLGAVRFIEGFDPRVLSLPLSRDGSCDETM